MGTAASKGTSYGRNPFDNSAQGMSQAMNIARDATGGVITGPVTAAGGIDTYMNPYTQNAVMANNDEIARQLGIMQSANAANAHAAGAFGGSRHGLVEANTNRAALDAMARQGANMYHNGYGLALQGAMGDADRALAGSQTGVNNALNIATTLGNLSSGSYNMGTNINSAMAGYGNQAQQLSQMLIDSAGTMFQNYTAQPEQLLQMRLAALGVNPLNASTTTQQTGGSEAGLGGILGLLLQTAGAATNITL